MYFNASLLFKKNVHVFPCISKTLPVYKWCVTNKLTYFFKLLRLILSGGFQVTLVLGQQVVQFLQTPSSESISPGEQHEAQLGWKYMLILSNPTCSFLQVEQRFCLFQEHKFWDEHQTKSSKIFETWSRCVLTYFSESNLCGKDSYKNIIYMFKKICILVNSNIARIL